jgi:hypothetical protein
MFSRNINIPNIIIRIINLSHMSEAVPAAQKTKKIARPGPGRQVRLWVRAKFLSFRRYRCYHVDPKSAKTSTKPSSDLKESTIELLLHTTSERESPISIKPIQAKLRIDSEYIYL